MEGGVVNSDELHETATASMMRWAAVLVSPETISDMAEAVLAVEVSPGVTLGDAVRAYLALERMGVVHDVAVSRSLKDPASWTCDWADVKFVDFERDALRPTLAAAILAAAEAPDGDS